MHLNRDFGVILHRTSRKLDDISKKGRNTKVLKYISAILNTIIYRGFEYIEK